MNTLDVLTPDLDTIALPALQMAGSGAVAGTPRPVEELPLRHGSPKAVKTNPRIMIVDDEPINIRVIQKFLSTEGYQNFITLSDSTKVLETIRYEEPDVILLDVMMPRVSGLEILEATRREEKFFNLPIVIVTASNDQETKKKALELGANDFLTKPVDYVDLVSRVRNLLMIKGHQDRLKNYAWELEEKVGIRTAELAQSQLELIYCLAKAGEFRDHNTGRHVLRVGRYVGIVARQMGFPPDRVMMMERAAILHDIGKIGIADAILRKPGKLESSEFAEMQYHTDYGKKVCDSPLDGYWATFSNQFEIAGKLSRGAISPILKMAGIIAHTHHERWDGTGYPAGLAGGNIPIEGRITAAADVFDALSSHRPYKKALALDECFRIIQEGSGTHFDPTVIVAFFAHKEDLIAVHKQYADAE